MTFSLFASHSLLTLTQAESEPPESRCYERTWPIRWKLWWRFFKRGHGVRTSVWTLTCGFMLPWIHIAILIHFHTTRCMSRWEPPTLGITLCTCKTSMKDRRQKIRRELKAQRELKAKAASEMLACNHMLQDMEDMISSPWFSYVLCVRVHASHASVYQIDGNIWTNFEQIFV